MDIVNVFFGHFETRSNLFVKEAILPRFQHVDITRWNSVGDGCGRVPDARVDELLECVVDRVGMGGDGNETRAVVQFSEVAFLTILHFRETLSNSMYCSDVTAA